MVKYEIYLGKLPYCMTLANPFKNDDRLYHDESILVLIMLRIWTGKLTMQS